MTRRIDIELTSRAAEHWTWRAAGAKQPKGSLGPDLIPDGATVGDVLIAEVESSIDGIEVLALLPKAARADTVARIEILGAPKREPGIEVRYAPKGRGERGERGDRGDRGERDGPRRERRRPTEKGRPGGVRTREEKSSEGRPREFRAPVSTLHRNAMLAELGPEQLPVAEQLIRGGIPAVRRALAEQLKAGRGPANADAILAIAEGLLPTVNLAEWKDRASGAAAHGDEIALSDLRSAVTAARAISLDDEARELSKTLQSILERRSAALVAAWQEKVAAALDNGRVLDALRAVQRPPERSTRLPADLAVRLGQAIGEAMTADTEPEKWLALLDATLESPVRRTVKPLGIPDSPIARESALHASGLVPELAKLLGVRIPPPPPRKSTVRRVSVSRSSGGGSKAAP